MNSVNICQKYLSRFWPIIFLCVLTFLLRIYKIEELFYFTYDESIPAFVGRRFWLWYHLPLIGGVTPFGFHLGPYFYWFYAILLFLGNLNPLIWGWASAIFATLTTCLIYIVGKDFGNKKIAITAAVFWTFSYLANVYDRHLWALYWGPISALLTVLSLSKIISGQKNFIYILAIVLALSIHADPSNLVFIVFAVLVWIVFKLPLDRKVLLATSIIIFSFLPLVMFDLRHNFANTKPIINFINNGQNKPGFNLEKAQDNLLMFPKTFSRLIYVQSDNEISKQYSYCPVYAEGKLKSVPWFLTIAFSIILMAFVALSLRKKTPLGWKLILILLLTYFFGIQIYGTIFQADIFEHYITGTFSIMLLIAARFVSYLPKRVWLLLIAIFISVNVYKTLNAKNNLGLKVKKQAIEYTIAKVGDKPFSLDSLSTCWKLNGYRYLFTIYGREPVKSYVDPNLSYLYGTTPVWEKHPETVVAFVAHDFILSEKTLTFMLEMKRILSEDQRTTAFRPWESIPETNTFYKRYALLKSHETANSIFGNLEVIIMDNASGWFDSEIAPN